MPQTRPRGKFWPKVRQMIYLKAQQLFQMEQACTMGEDFKGITAEPRELHEGGYFYTAKLLVLRELYYERKGLPAFENEEHQRGNQDL